MKLKQLNENLLLAAKEGNTKEIKQLINFGANINCKDNSHNTPLMWTVIRENQEGVKLLIKNGADVNKPNHLGLTPLYKGLFKKNEKIVKLLLEAGASKDSQSQDKIDNLPINLKNELLDIKPKQFALETLKSKKIIEKYKNILESFSNLHENTLKLMDNAYSTLEFNEQITFEKFLSVFDTIIRELSAGKLTGKLLQLSLNANTPLEIYFLKETIPNSDGFHFGNKIVLGSASYTIAKYYNDEDSAIRGSIIANCKNIIAHEMTHFVDGLLENYEIEKISKSALQILEILRNKSINTSIDKNGLNDFEKEFANIFTHYKENQYMEEFFARFVGMEAKYGHVAAIEYWTNLQLQEPTEVLYSELLKLTGDTFE